MRHLAELVTAVSLTGIGDAFRAVACLLELEPLDSQTQQQLLQSMPFAATQAILLLRMSANALLVRSSLYDTNECLLLHRPVHSV